MTPPHHPAARNRVSFKRVALTLGGCAVLVAVLNLYMNVLASYTAPSLQLDLSLDGDIMGVHPHPPDDSGEARRFQNSELQAISPLQDGVFFNPESCMGLCGFDPKQRQSDYVVNMIEKRLSHLGRNSFRIQHDPMAANVSRPLLEFATDEPAEKIWKEVGSWVDGRRTTPSMEELVSSGRLKAVIGAAASSPVLRSSVPSKGTQLKAAVLLEGGQWALWKPQRFARDISIVSDSPYAGADRHNGEIAAFHISGLLGLDRTPVVVGRKLHFLEDLFHKGDSTLKNTMYNDSSNQLCFFGRCLYCRREESVCTAGEVEGALILWFPPPFDKLTRIRSPWARTYAARPALWETQANFCASVAKHEFFGAAPIFLDLMDMAIFDWLLGNADRHRLELFSSGPRPRGLLLLLDNGKSFGNPEQDTISILAPIYQCCRIRRRLYLTLLRFSELNFGSVLDERLRVDPLYPILSSPHLEALNRRIRKALIVLATCIERFGENVVLVDDGF